MPHDGNTTRQTILVTAMRMFIDDGYDKTSLREIAEAVGVTKAALYYHFRTKEDIVRAAIDEYTIALGGILTWLAGEPPGEGRDIGFVDRVMDLFAGPGSLPLRFRQNNPTVVARESFAGGDVDDVTRLMDALAGKHPSADVALRSTLAIGALVIGATPEAPIAQGGSETERREAARALALELLASLRTVS